MKTQTFVLVHGAWHGGWCWQRVARLLRALGHEVFTPTLTGLGERSHLLSARVDLAVHIADVVNVIKWEGLNHVVLCGHSYAGFVISGVAEQCEAELAALVFLDAFLPQDGDRMVDITSQATRDAIEGAAKRGDIGVPPRPAAFFQVNEKDRAWVDTLCTPHPIATMLSPIRLTGARERVARKAYVRARPYPNPGFDDAVARLRREPGWRVTDVPCGHDVMVDMPERLTELLLEAAPE
jgi:pimeloyl-ACP methyl ester carboxylesterase